MKISLFTFITLFIVALGTEDALAATDWQTLGPCARTADNVMIARLGPLGVSAMCPEWDTARREWNLKRDRPSIPLPSAEYRVRLETTERR